MTVSEAVALLKEKDNFLIITHIRPDGDTIGSGSALCYALRKYGKTAYLYQNPQFGDFCPWISAPYISPENFSPEFVIAVDTADVTMFPKGFSGHVNLAFDHHPSNTAYADNNIVWSDRASCGELIMEVVKGLCGLDEKVSDLLYVAVATDTGCFLYGNTTADTHRAAAELCEAGASNAYLNKLLFRSSSRERLALESMVFSTLHFHHENRTVIAIVTKEMLEKAEVKENDLNDLASLPGRVEGASTSVLIKEHEEGSKVSLRTNGIVNASEVCAEFGGGGHKMAAGCCIKTDCEKAEKLLIEAIGRYYK